MVSALTPLTVQANHQELAVDHTVTCTVEEEAPEEDEGPDPDDEEEGASVGAVVESAGASVGVLVSWVESEP
jgi:hypothetical protein